MSPEQFLKVELSGYCTGPFNSGIPFANNPGTNSAIGNHIDAPSLRYTSESYVECDIVDINVREPCTFLMSGVPTSNLATSFITSVQIFGDR